MTDRTTRGLQPGETLQNFLKDVAIRDLDNPKSVIHYCPKALQERIAALSPEILDMTVEELIEKRPALKNYPLSSQLRRAFWNEFERALVAKTVMDTRYIYPAFCSPQGWQKMIDCDWTLSFILKQPEDYQEKVADLLELGMRRIRDILNLPILDKKGQPNPKVGELILKTTMMLDMRKHGGFIQRAQIHQKTEAHHTHEEIPARIEDIDEKLARLEAEAKTALVALPSDSFHPELVGLKEAMMASKPVEVPLAKPSQEPRTTEVVQPEPTKKKKGRTGFYQKQLKAQGPGKHDEIEDAEISSGD